MKDINKKLVLIVILLLFILTIMINLFIKVTVTDNDEKKQYIDETISIKYNVTGKYEPSIINAEYAKLTQSNVDSLDNTIDYIVDCINHKQYAELYAKMDDDYKKVKFDTLQKFIEFCDKKFENGDCNCVSFRLKDSSCYIKLGNSIANDNENFGEIKFINYTNRNNLKIYFEDIQRIVKAGALFDISGFKIKTKYLIEYSDKIAMNLEVSNSTNNDEEIICKDFGLITVINGQEYSISSSANGNIKVPAKQIVQAEIYIDKEDSFIFLPSFMTLKIDFDGNEYDMKSLIGYEDEV